MFRRIAMLAIVLVVATAAAAPAVAQEQEITITTAAANVHKGPSTGSPVVGKAPHGTVLEVTRNLGDWVKVTWIDMPDNVGYVHLSGAALHARGASPRAVPAPRSSEAAPTRTPAPYARTAPGTPRASDDAVRTRTAVLQAEPISHAHKATPDPVYITPPSHRFGLGGQVTGSALGYGGSARLWSRRKLGVQVDVSRFALTSQVTPGRVTSFQFAPGVLYSLPDRVSDYFWFRPYLGASVAFQRHRFSETSAAGIAASESRVGYHAFGGGEVTFASVPRFALSADLGYRWADETPFAGFELGRVAFTVSGRFYVR